MTQRWAKELEAALAAVRQAAEVCRTVQQKLVDSNTLQKRDRSPVTVADFASQAIVCAHLQATFPGDPVVAEEDSQELRAESNSAVRGTVVELVGASMGKKVGVDAVLGWIDRGGGAGAKDTGGARRFWTLDPIDGTKGFLRNEQYAVALALIEDGRVVLGVLGCPNLDGQGKSGAVAGSIPGAGALLFATEESPARMCGLGGTWGEALKIRVSPVEDVREARFCESVESSHSDQGASTRIAAKLGITAQPVRVDSQAKYALIARGEASIYLRLPTRADYTEKIWDHAAGAIVVERAGGKVTDIHGKPLDFSLGSTLKGNQGIIATNGLIHGAVVEAVGAVRV